MAPNFLHNHIVITSDPHQQKCCPVHIQIKGVIRKICFNLTPDPSVFLEMSELSWVHWTTPSPGNQWGARLHRIPQDKDVWWSAAGAEEGHGFFVRFSGRKGCHCKIRIGRFQHNWDLVKMEVFIEVWFKYVYWDVLPLLSSWVISPL